MGLKRKKMLLDRKALEIGLQEDSDDDEEIALNLVETDGKLYSNVENWDLQVDIFPSIDDVWDDDSAYMELLAEQVNYHCFL